MGMGYGANYADVVTANFVKKIRPKEYADFMKALKAADVDFDSFAQSLNNTEDEELSKKFAYLCASFYEATKDASSGKGLLLNVGFHDKTEEGDRYDEVDGGFFAVGGAYEMTPSGKQFAKQIKRKFYVTFG
jgi:hypothetical protein